MVSIKRKQKIILIIILIGILLFASKTSFNLFSIMQPGGTVIPLGDDYLYQYAPDSSCIDMPNYLWSSSAKLKTYKSTFEFKVVSAVPTQSAYNHVYSLCDSNAYLIDVYKDGKLIDSVGIAKKGESVLEKIGLNACTELKNLARPYYNLEKSYSDNGEIFEGKLPEGKTGINVVFAKTMFRVPCENARIVKLINRFKIIYPEDLIIIKLEKAKKSGGYINVGLNINSKMNGKAKLELELIPKGLFKKSIKQEKEINLIKGINKVEFSYYVGDKNLSEFKIQPNLELFAITNNFLGLNADESLYDDGKEGKSINLHKEIKIQDYSFGYADLAREVTIPSLPQPSGFGKFISSIINFIKNLFK